MLHLTYDNVIVDILYETIHSILVDEDFNVIPETTTLSIQSCAAFLQFAKQQPTVFSLFADQIISYVTSLVHEAITKVPKRTKHQTFVANFKKAITSTNYQIFWAKFAEAAGTRNTPIMNYYVTHKLYQTKLTSTTPSLASGCSEQITVTLTEDEKAAIVYVGGYIIRKCIQQVSATHTDFSKTCLYLLFQLLEDPDFVTNENSSLDIFDIKNWSKLVDRGGLLHSAEDFVNVLLQIERTIKEILYQSPSGRRKTSIPIASIKEQVLSCPIICELWTNSFIGDASADLPSKQQLLEMITTQYIKVRGFAFTASYMEKYKYKHNKQLSKTKSLRSTLNTCSKEE